MNKNMVKQFFNTLLKAGGKKCTLKDIIFIEGSTQKNGPMHTIKITSYPELWSWMTTCEKQNKDVYFYINGGGTKVKDINKIRSYYIDMDAGRDKQRKYLSKELVDKKKGSMLKAINFFKHKPSYVVETRNGYQVYWFTYDFTLPNMEDFVKTQYKLWNKFKNYGADSYCLRPNQLFRVPGSNWFKFYENTGDTFKTDFVIHNGPVGYIANDFKALKSPATDKETGKLVIPEKIERNRVKSFDVAAKIKNKRIVDTYISFSKKTTDSLNKLKLAFEQLSLILGDLFNAAGNNTKS